MKICHLSLLRASLKSLETGSGNNEKGIIVRDFHCDMHVLAATRIEHVQIAIKQQAGKTYSKEWSFEHAWEEFKGTKDANVHKHIIAFKSLQAIITRSKGTQKTLIVYWIFFLILKRRPLALRGNISRNFYDRL